MINFIIIHAKFHSCLGNTFHENFTLNKILILLNTAFKKCYIQQEAIEKWEFYEKTSVSLGQLLDATEAKLAPDQLEAISSFELEHYFAETKVSQKIKMFYTEFKTRFM